ncbi:TM1812 family CRISPR-associated protein [uncultured Selenomonas sp.]|uniref:TM1812 family CRISPR-associated protein n=1 Tax=uncultured Selenomonas sp. TaxID=159275 RepID=UPI0028F03CCC|nr:TM1812 family CRISPR-associated protein [uncultured Selenomonas sp.]
MRHHIMLLMLSDVKTDRNHPERVSMVKYAGDIGDCGVTNESAVRHLLLSQEDDRNISLDKMFLFATKKVQEPIEIEQPSPDVDPGVTHFGYFKKRLTDVLPCVEESGFIEVVPYDARMPISETRRFVLEMAERIMDYAEAKKAQGDTVVLHADLTGGPRHAVMLMFAVMRLLQYNGIEIGKVLYSNMGLKIVEEVNDVYGIFDLIAGADEFAQFGSVSAILRYFGYDKKILARPPHISERLHQLLLAMHGFAEEIKVCHYGAFAHAVEELSKALKEFREGSEADGADINEGMIAQLRFRVEEEYREILGEKIDDVKLLRWCVNHGYLQQALTLFTERVPAILTERKILQFTEDFAAKVQASMRETDKRSWVFYLFADYKDSKGVGQVDAFLENAKKAYRRIMQTIMADALDGKEAAFSGEEGWAAQLHRSVAKESAVKYWPERAHESLVLENEEDVRQIYEKLLAWGRNPQDFQGKAPADSLWDSLADALCEKQLNMPEDADKTAREALKKEWHENFCAQRYGKTKLKALEKFVRDNMKASTADKIFSNVSLVPGTKELFSFRYCLEQGGISCRIPHEDFYALLDIYYRLKEERNQSNHAREDSKPGGAKELRSLFEEALPLLERF